MYGGAEGGRKVRRPYDVIDHARMLATIDGINGGPIHGKEATDLPRRIVAKIAPIQHLRGEPKKPFWEKMTA